MAVSNVELQPGDTVVVPKAGIVYVLEGNSAGGYVLKFPREEFTVLQV